MEKCGWLVYLSNAAVFLQYNGVKILIDGLYRDNSGYFSQLPDAVWDGMQKGNGELAHIDYLLFTHSHADHFYEPYVLQYLRNNHVKGYALPCSDNTLYGCRAISFDTENEVELEKGIICRYVDIRHLDPRFYNVTNRCYILKVGVKNLLFLGDADYQEESFQELVNEEIDIAFVTPIFFNHPSGRRILQEILCVRKVILYHLPFSQEDTMQMEKMARRDMVRYAKEDQLVVIWNKTGQALVL